VVPNPERTGAAPLVDLDPAFYKLFQDFRARFPGGAPSLKACDGLTVRGDVLFEGGVEMVGATEVRNAGTAQARVPAGSRLTGHVELPGD